MMRPVVVTPPAAEPVTLAEIKAHLKIASSNQDDYLVTLIAAARAHLEKTLGRAFIAQTLEVNMDGFHSGEILLPRPPLVSVTSITYLDTAAVSRTLAAETYHVEPAEVHGRVLLASGSSWPATAPHQRAVTVRYVAGWDSPAAFPADLKHALKLLIGHWYYNREAATDQRQVMPLAYDALTAPFMTHGWI